MKKNFYYTSERNVQIVIALLKAHGIHWVIASPGTTNMTFVVSIENDPWFQVWSSVDERSAAYLACGMAAETLGWQRYGTCLFAGRSGGDSLLPAV